MNRSAGRSLVRFPESLVRGFVCAVLIVALDAPLRAQSSGFWPDPDVAPDPTQDAIKGQIPKDSRDQAGSREVVQMKEVHVRPGELAEEQPVGETQQPEWTTRRRFPSTRVYLQTLPGEAEFEQWYELRKSKESGVPDETRLSQEFEFGLGYRMQLDLYLNELHTRDGADSSLDFRGTSIELRYALADWNEIWGNPTLYLEYTMNNNEPDQIEPKLLLGGELAKGWHWGVNFAHERSLAGQRDRAEEFSTSWALSRTIIDEKLSIGPTFAMSYEASPDETTGLHDHATEVLIGPSLQFIPTPRANLQIEPLWGLTGDSHKLRLFAVFSWRF